MLDGDGYVCRFSFAGGNNVHFLSRYVQTRQALLMNENLFITISMLNAPVDAVPSTHLCHDLHAECTCRCPTKYTIDVFLRKEPSSLHMYASMNAC